MDHTTVGSARFGSYAKHGCSRISHARLLQRNPCGIAQAEQATAESLPEDLAAMAATATLDAGVQTAVEGGSFLVLGQNVTGAATAAENEVENNGLKHVILSCFLCLISPFSEGPTNAETPTFGVMLPTEVYEEDQKDNVKPLPLNPF